MAAKSLSNGINCIRPWGRLKRRRAFHQIPRVRKINVGIVDENHFSGTNTRADLAQPFVIVVGAVSTMAKEGRKLCRSSLRCILAAAFVWPVKLPRGNSV